MNEKVYTFLKTVPRALTVKLPIFSEPSIWQEPLEISCTKIQILQIFLAIEVDVVITMGCNVQCPLIPCSHREDWGLADPTGKDDRAF